MSLHPSVTPFLVSINRNVRSPTLFHCKPPSSAMAESILIPFVDRIGYITN